jgi:GNAT superfamily N-acetyltransferase
VERVGVEVVHVHPASIAVAAVTTRLAGAAPPGRVGVLRTGIASVTVHHRTLGILEVGPVPPEVTFALRREVLRPHQPIEEMFRLDSPDPAAVVMAARGADGTVVATGTVMPEDPPASLAGTLPPGPYWRLRGMATSADARGAGVGGAVLERLMDHVAGRGAGVVWCAARVRAVPFYERAGFRTAGAQWVDPDIGPHVHMWVELSGEPGPGA